MESFNAQDEENDRPIIHERRVVEMNMREEETDTRVEQLQKELQEQARIASEQAKISSEQRREYEQHLQKHAREIQLAREQLRECEQHLEERTREAQVVGDRLRVCEQHLVERTREAQVVGEQLRVCEQHLQEHIRDAQSARDELKECEQHLPSDWVVRREEIDITGPELGRGGWATVSVASFRGVRVAAKVIHNQIISYHNIQLVRREMRMAATLRHPNLVQFIGATDEGDMVILTELMPTTLRAQLQQDVYLQPKLVISISLDVARALNYLHQMKPDPVIHRDISSVNVLLEPLPGGQWRAKLSDYGTVNLVCQLETVHPGSPAYAAPEANYPILQSPKMDIYSFGALILEMLTGQLPAPEDRPALLLKVHHDQLLDLIQRCLLEGKHDRPDAGTIIGVLTIAGQ